MVHGHFMVFTLECMATVGVHWGNHKHGLVTKFGGKQCLQEPTNAT